jgi:hypothetical protein
MIGIPMSKPPEVLYHYCSTESFYGIITSKNIRLCNCLYSNDPNENKISQNILNIILHDSDDEEIKRFAKKILEHKFGSFDESGAYVFCMSEKADDLNQWRIYGDNGFGFMIGLNTKYFIDNEYWKINAPNVIFPDFDKILLCKCIYDISLQTELIESWIKIFLTEIHDISEEQKILKLKHILQLYSAIFKHESYSEEQEWRLICFPFSDDQFSNIKHKLHFGAKKGLISQFIQFDYMSKSEFGNTPFEFIYLGSNVENNAHEIRNFTEFQGGHYVNKIKKSELKMRLK